MVLPEGNGSPVTGCRRIGIGWNWSPRKQRWTPNSKSSWFRERSSCNRIFFWISMKFHLSLRGCSYKMDSTTAGCISWGPTGKRVQKWRSGRTAQLSLLHLHNKVSGIIWRNQCRTKSQLRSAFRPFIEIFRINLQSSFPTADCQSTSASRCNRKELKIVEAEDCEVDKIPVQDCRDGNFHHETWWFWMKTSSLLGNLRKLPCEEFEAKWGNVDLIMKQQEFFWRIVRGFINWNQVARWSEFRVRDPFRKTLTMRPTPSFTCGISPCCTWSREQATGGKDMGSPQSWSNNDSSCGVYIYVCIYICMYIYIYVCIYICIYIHS